MGPAGRTGRAKTPDVPLGAKATRRKYENSSTRCRGESRVLHTCLLGYRGTPLRLVIPHSPVGTRRRICDLLFRRSRKERQKCPKSARVSGSGRTRRRPFSSTSRSCGILRIDHIQRSPAAWPGGAAGDVILISFSWPAKVSRRSTAERQPITALPLQSRCSVPIKPRSIGCGQRSPPTAGRRSCAAGYATDGDFPGRSCRTILPRLLADPDPAVSARVFAAMQGMVKLDAVALERAAESLKRLLREGRDQRPNDRNGRKTAAADRSFLCPVSTHCSGCEEASGLAPEPPDPPSADGTARGGGTAGGGGAGRVGHAVACVGGTGEDAFDEGKTTAGELQQRHDTVALVEEGRRRRTGASGARRQGDGADGCRLRCAR